MISDSFLFTVYCTDLSRVVRLFNFEACIGVLGIQDICHFTMLSILLPGIWNTVGGGGDNMVMSWYICAVGIFHTHAPYSCNTNFSKLNLFMYNYMNEGLDGEGVWYSQFIKNLAHYSSH